MTELMTKAQYADYIDEDLQKLEAIKGFILSLQLQKISSHTFNPPLPSTVKEANVLRNDYQFNVDTTPNGAGKVLINKITWV